MQNTANASLAEKSQLERHTSFSAASATHRKCDRQLAFNLRGNVNLVIHVCIQVEFTALNSQVKVIVGMNTATVRRRGQTTQPH